jgi:hypothetical protein
VAVNEKVLNRLYTFDHQKLEAVAELLGSMHPEWASFLDAYDTGLNSIHGIIKAAEQMDQHLIGLVQSDLSTAYSSDTRFKTLIDVINIMGKQIKELRDNSWWKITDSVTWSPGEIGMLSRSWIHYTTLSYNDKGGAGHTWSPISTFLAERDTGTVLGPVQTKTGSWVTDISTLNITPSVSRGFSANHEYTLSGVIWFTTDQHYGSECDITWGGAIGVPMLRLTTFDRGYAGYVEWTVDILATKRSEGVDSGKIAAVYYGADEALQGIGFTFFVNFVCPKTWMAGGVPTDIPDHDTFNKTLDGPFKYDISIELLQGATFTWIELTTPAGVGAPHIGIHKTIANLDERVTALENATGTMIGASEASHSGLGNKLHSYSSYAQVGATALRLLGMFGVPGADGLAGALAGVSQGLLQAAGVADDLAGSPVVHGLGKYLLSKGVNTTHLMGMIKEAGKDQVWGQHIADYYTQQMLGLKQIKELPDGITLDDALPSGMYYGQRLGRPPQFIIKFGEKLLQAGQNGYIDLETLALSSNKLPIHGYVTLIFPDVRAAHNIKDKSGLNISAYIRRVVLCEFIASEDAVQSNGYGTVFFAFATQYWDVTFNHWHWSDTRTEDYTLQIDTSGSTAEWTARLEDYFFSDVRREFPLTSFVPMVDWNGFLPFRNSYITLSSNYNVFNNNCQTLALETLKYVTLGIYPQWWPKITKSDTLFQYIKNSVNDSAAPALSSVQLDELQTALKNLNSVSYRYSL